MPQTLCRDISELKSRAKKIRKDIIRMLTKAGSGHPGGSLSATDLIVALYYGKMNHDPANPHWPDRDRFVLSKGHGCPALYATLAELGYFQLSELDTLRQFGCLLQGHPDMKRTPGIEISSGSLGQGLSVGNGMALAGRLDRKGYRVYVMLGDGEIEEGQIWEAAMAAGHYKLDNICAIIDNNGLQIDGPIKDIMSAEPIAKKWRAFRWHVIEINGHGFQQILNAYDEAEATKGMPTAIVAKTIKGKGVSFMENQVDWHGKAPNPEQAEQALAELEKEE